MKYEITKKNEKKKEERICLCGGGEKKLKTTEDGFCGRTSESRR